MTPEIIARSRIPFWEEEHRIKDMSRALALIHLQKARGGRLAPVRAHLRAPINVRQAAQNITLPAAANPDIQNRAIAALQTAAEIVIPDI